MENRIPWNRIKSMLFVPANRDRLKHIADIPADAFIIDLEDAIKQGKKDEAREELKEWLGGINTDIMHSIIILRINKECIEYEAELFSKEPIFKGIAIPKLESKSEIERAKRLFPDKDLVGIIETPKGMLNLDIISAYDEIKAICFGGEDFCVSMEMEKHENLLLPIKQNLLLYAKAYNKKAFDMVEAEYKNIDIITEAVKDAKDMGFSGKLAIHPNQVKVINQIYKNIEKDKLLKIITEYEKRNEGFVMIDGIIYEKPHIDRMRALLNE